LKLVFEHDSGLGARHDVGRTGEAKARAANDVINELSFFLCAIVNLQNGAVNLARYRCSIACAASGPIAKAVPTEAPRIFLRLATLSLSPNLQ
jgi:hypothetical protein